MKVSGLGFVDGNHVYVCSANTLYCVNIKTGDCECTAVGQHKKGIEYLDQRTYNIIEKKCTRKVVLNITK